MIVRDDCDQNLRQKLSEMVILTDGENSHNKSNLALAEDKQLDRRTIPNETPITVDLEAESNSNICSRNVPKSCDCRYEEIALQVRHIRNDIEHLRHRVEACETCEVGNSTLDYDSILKLRRDNISLQSDLEVANATIKKLEARISELQNDKASLITAIKIVQEDNGQSQTMATQEDANPWAEAKTKAKAKGNIKRKNKKKRKHDDHDNPGELNANTNPANSDNNRYESLADLPTKETNNVNLYEDHQQIPKDTENNNADSTNSPSKVIIAGDSITKHLNGFKMSTAKTKVQVSTFPGCTTLDMKDHINPILRKKPDKLIVHVGTNNLRGRETPAKCAEEIISLAKAIKSNLPTTTVAVSGLTTRTDNDNLAVKVNEVNSSLKQLCRQINVNFIDHSNITPNHLNRSGIYLNKMGTSLLARNFNNSIYNRDK